MNRRKFIKNSAGIIIPSLFIPRLIRAQAFSARDTAFVGATKQASGGGGSSSLLTGLQAYYKLEDTSDSSGNSLTLTNNGVVTFVAGKVNNAGNFVSASSQFLSHADAAPYQMGTGDFTLCAWVKFTTPSVIKVIVGYGQSGGKEYRIYCQDGGLLARVGDGTNTAQVGDIHSFNNNAYHFAVMTAARAGNLTLYVDNTLEQATSMTTIGSVNNATGGFNIGDENGGLLWDGNVDEVSLYNRVLTGTELTCLWNSGNGTTTPFTGVCLWENMSRKERELVMESIWNGEQSRMIA